MKVHIVSDLHINWGPVELPGNADILILAGDLVEHSVFKLPSTEKFINEELTKYPQVLYVLGNHEFYKGSIKDTPAFIQERMPANVTLMNNMMVKVGDWHFVGSTLWTDCNKGDQLTYYHLSYGMNDFKHIAYEKDPWQRFTPKLSHDIHDWSKGYINEVVRNKENVFVITHHAPTFKSISPQYVSDMLMNGGYASDLSDLILDNPQIKYWVHGHMHSDSDYMVGDCRVICHPRGYLGHEPQASKYRPLEIEL